MYPSIEEIEGSASRAYNLTVKRLNAVLFDNNNIRAK